MTATKKLGIWMDHSNAHLVEVTSSPIDLKKVESTFTYQAKQHSLGRGEHLMHNREQHQQAEYYKHLGDIIRNYEEVVLFGPAEAKEELHNLLKADHQFGKIKIEVKQADKMTENQQHAFVKKHFHIA